MLTEDKSISIYCIVDDILKGIGHKEDVRRKISDSEIINSTHYSNNLNDWKFTSYKAINSTKTN